MMSSTQILAIIALMLGISTTALAADDVRGEKLFNYKCRACHSLVEGKNKVGPSLYGMFGREAGSLPGYKFSKALKSSDIVWDEETLDKWLQDSRKFISGTKMRFKMKKEQDRKDIIDYLEKAIK